MSSEQSLLHVDKVKCLSSCAVWKLCIAQSNKNTTVENKLEGNRQESKLYQDVSLEKIVSFLKEKDELNSASEISKGNNDVIESEKSYPIDNTNLSIWEEGLNKSVIKIEFDLGINDRFSQIDKNFVKAELNCTLNGVLIHNSKVPIFTKDIQFILKPKRLIKSIQICIEAIKQKHLVTGKKTKLSQNLFFINIIETNNIAILVQKDIPDLEALPTNFNSLVNGGFTLKKIYILLPVPDKIPKTKSSNLQDELYSLGSASTMSSVGSNFSSSSSGSFINLCKKTKPKVNKISLMSYAFQPNLQLQQMQLQMQAQIQKKNILLSTPRYNLSNYNRYDEYAKAVIDNYRIKSKNPYFNRTICNFSIFKKAIIPKVTSPPLFNRSLTLNDIFSSFNSYSAFGLTVSLIANNTTTKEVYAPSLSSMSIFSINTRPIEFFETKPPFMRIPFNDQIDCIFTKEQKQITLDKIDKEKSFFCIAWNPLKASTSTIFLAFYQFGIMNQEINLVGVLPIRVDCDFWIGNLLYDKMYCEKEINESIERVENFIYINSYTNTIVKSSDYDYYYGNKMNKSVRD